MTEHHTRKNSCRYATALHFGNADLEVLVPRLVRRGVSVAAIVMSAVLLLLAAPAWGQSSPSLQDIQTTGSMSAGSNQVTLAAPAGFKIGDGIIVATGGEAGRGLRGTVGVGGVWPRLAYSDVSTMRSDKSRPANTFARLVTDPINGNGSVYQWDGSSWTYVNDYYFNKSIPRALVGYVCTVSNGGTVLTLATQPTNCSRKPFKATVTTSGAEVYYDNAPLLNALWNGAVNANYTYVLPSGSYAVGNEVDVVGGDLSNPLNSTIAGQGGYPTCGTTLFSPAGATSATLNTNVYNFTFRDFCMTGNVRNAGGYGPDWSVMSETGLYYPGVVEHGIYLDPSPNTTVKNMTFTDTWGAVGAEASDNIIVQNVNYTASDPILVEQWAFVCADTDEGCSFSNISVTSNNGLTPGFSCFRGFNCTLANVASVNGLFDLNDSGNWKIQGAQVTITPNSANVWSGIYSPIFPVTSNIGLGHIRRGGQLNNVSLVVQGYIDGTNGIQGAAINNPNITIDADGSSSSYSAPDCASGAIIGPTAIVSNDGAPMTIINNMTAVGAACPGQANFQLSPGVGDQCNNCTGTVSGLP
jgi:hypothetical protein